jgi:hypothetical protein
MPPTRHHDAATGTLAAAGGGSYHARENRAPIEKEETRTRTHTHNTTHALSNDPNHNERVRRAARPPV